MAMLPLNMPGEEENMTRVPSVSATQPMTGSLGLAGKSQNVEPKKDTWKIIADTMGDIGAMMQGQPDPGIKRQEQERQAAMEEQKMKMERLSVGVNLFGMLPKLKEVAGGDPKAIGVIAPLAAEMFQTTGWKSLDADTLSEWFSKGNNRIKLFGDIISGKTKVEDLTEDHKVVFAEYPELLKRFGDREEKRRRANVAIPALHKLIAEGKGKIKTQADVEAALPEEADFLLPEDYEGVGLKSSKRAMTEAEAKAKPAKDVTPSEERRLEEEADRLGLTDEARFDWIAEKKKKFALERQKSLVVSPGSQIVTGPEASTFK